MKKTLLLLVVAFTLFSCDSGKIFQRYEDLPENIWTRDKVISFKVDITDITSPYDVDLALRHSSYYTWANLKVNLKVTYPSGEIRTKDYDCFVRNTDGSFKGEGAGDLFDITFPWLEDFTFTETGSYTFEVSNIMPYPQTEDVMQIGLIVRKAG